MVLDVDGESKFDLEYPQNWQLIYWKKIAAEFHEFVIGNETHQISEDKFKLILEIFITDTVIDACSVDWILVARIIQSIDFSTVSFSAFYLNYARTVLVPAAVSSERNGHLATCFLNRILRAISNQVHGDGNNIPSFKS